MKVFLVIFFSLFLVGCSVPIKRSFPEIPQKLLEPCEKLQKLEEKDLPITEFLRTVVTNYRYHHECSIKVEYWQEWYKKQKQIFESVK